MADRGEKRDERLKEMILESIDQLRKRKARPDLGRICHMLARKYGIKASDVTDELQRLVKENVVIKVDYKGNTSYRNAAKWVRTKSMFLSGLNDTDLSNAVLEAVEALNLSFSEQDGNGDGGVPFQDIERYLMKRDSQGTLNPTKIRAVLEKEVVSGALKQLPSGEFVLRTAAAPKSVPNPPLRPTPSNVETAPKSDSENKGRPASTRKRFKKTHGPDFVDTTCVVPTDSPGEIRCDYCLLSANANINGEPEDLLVCKDCNAKAHPSCMDYTVELATRSQLSPWQCTDCKTCTICEDSGDGDLVLFCDLCDKGYHMNCHSPPVAVKPTGKWVCSCCYRDDPTKREDIKENISKILPRLTNSNSATGRHSPYSEKVKNGMWEKKVSQFAEEWLKKYPEVIPHAENWSIEDVEMFFRHIGYKEEAPAFREQEIDGQSLLLMKRSDVLTGLDLKLGPALKIYNHVKRLQSRVPNRFAS